MKQAVETKWPHLATVKVILQNDNAPTHASSAFVALLHELRFELLSHAPYLGLIPLPKSKEIAYSRRLSTKEDVIAVTILRS